MVCVNPSLKRQGNSTGTAWEQHENGMVCVNRPLTLLTTNSHFSNVIKFNCHGKNSIQQEDCFHQQLALKFKED
jgi:hypothetical protein